MPVERALAAGLELDVERVMHGGPSALEGAKVIGQLLSTSLGSVPGTPPAHRVRTALSRAVELLTPSYRREAARALLGLDLGLTSFSRRVDQMVRIYQEAAANGPEVPPRRHRQVLLRSEVPELRAAIVQALLDVERDFTSARRSEGRRHKSVRNVEQMGWDRYGILANRLAKQLRAIRPPGSFDLDSDDWAVIGISRGGLPLAVHLSHLLGCRLLVSSHCGSTDQRKRT